MKTDTSFFKRIEKNIKLGVAEALADHKRLGQSIVVAKNGKVVHIPPEKINVNKTLNS